MFEDIAIGLWQSARLEENFPVHRRAKDFDMALRLRGVALSIASHVAEGLCRSPRPIIARVTKYSTFSAEGLAKSDQLSSSPGADKCLFHNSEPFFVTVCSVYCGKV